MNPRIVVDRSKLTLARASILHRLYPKHLRLNPNGYPYSKEHTERLGAGLEKVTDTDLTDIALDALLNHLQNYSTTTPIHNPTGVPRLDSPPPAPIKRITGHLKFGGYENLEPPVSVKPV